MKALYYLVIICFCQFPPWVSSLVQTTSHHQLYYTIPQKHTQLHFLNSHRMNNTDLIFWNGLGGFDERVYILCSVAAHQSHQAVFQKQGLKLELVYKHVKIQYVSYNPNAPNTFPVRSRLEEEVLEDEQEEDENEKALNAEDPDENLEEKLLSGHNFTDQDMAERLIYKRKKKYFAPGGDTLESVGVTANSPGLVPITPILSFDNRHLTINTGLLYRIQGIQTLVLGNVTSSPETGEWVVTKEGKKTGLKPRIGEYLFASYKHERDGNNPYVTAEEATHWKNAEYQKNRTKGALWMFVPSEKEKWYEIRSRNYPASLLVWSYDTEEGENVLYLETRRSYLKRFQRDGTLRHRALFSFERVTSTYNWELVKDNRPKYWIYTYNQNHVYLYESTKRSCAMLVVRNSAERPYIPDKTDKIQRPLDMFYITRIDLTGAYTASIFSLRYDKSIVDTFSQSSEQPEGVNVLKDFQLVNRGPTNMTHFVFEEMKNRNNFTFKFEDSFKAFQWVTLDAHVPSFGIAPVVMTGLLGNHTNTKELKRSIVHEYEVQDKVVLEGGTWVNATVIFQKVTNFENTFSAIMEVTEPADRLYVDKQGKYRYIRMSLPGKMVENTWAQKAEFKYERVIEKREAAFVVQVKGKLVGSYGLRLFVKKTEMEYGAGIVSCGAGGEEKETEMR